MKSGKNLADLTNENKAHILRYLIHHEGISRIELSAATGLKPASITKIIQQLIEQELVTETGLSEGSKGRRSISLSFNYKKYSVLAIKLNWSRLKIDLMDFKGNSQDELYSISFPPLCIERMDEITSLIAQKVNEICSRHNNILAAGVACFGPLLQLSSIESSSCTNTDPLICGTRSCCRCIGLLVVSDQLRSYSKNDAHICRRRYRRRIYH